MILIENFDDIYRNYFSQVYFYVLDLCGSPDTAEEITQESFFRVLKKIDTFRGECSLKTWICQIAKNTYFNYCKKKKPEDAELDEKTTCTGDIESEFAEKETALDVHRALHDLSDPYREVFWMRTFGNLSFKEIGNIHKKTESWARVTYHRARLMLKEGYKDEV